MNFDESLKYLLNLGNEVLTMKLGLENIRILLAALENPERNYLKVQVAGTNGKGSTCAFLNSICGCADIKTGLYTSPHLVSITERIKINNREISKENFARHATRIREISENLLKNEKLETLPTFFEQVTAIAVSAFSEAKVELAILETGLGGRFDATTAANAEIAAITPIDFDHQNFLGNTLPEIAAEKAAIIREQTKYVIAAPQENQDVVHEIWLKCEENDLEPVWATADIGQENITVEQMLNGINFNTFSGSYSNIVLSLRGRHQFTNAILAVRIAEILRDFQFNISQENIAVGLQTAKHYGRLEFYKGILFDGAHNVSGAKALRNYLDEFIKQPITIVFGAMKDKDLSEIGEILFPKAEKIIFTEPDNPRSMKSSEMIKFLPENFDERNVFQTENVADALEIAEKVSGAENLICVTGSLYLVGEARKLVNNKSEI